MMQRSKFIEIVIAILCAVALWMIVVTEVSPEDDIVLNNIPVVFAGENELRSEYNLIVSKKDNSVVSVKFHGARADLKRLDKERNNLTAVVDVSTFTSEREYSGSFDVVGSSLIQGGAVRVVERKPSTVRFSVEKMASKMVRVKGNFNGTEKEGYEAGELYFNQDTIKVTGPKELVDKVSYAQVSVSDTNVSETIVRMEAVTLYSGDNEEIRSNDLVLSAPEIEVTLQVFMKKTVPVTATYLYGPGAMEGTVSVTIMPETLTVLGTEEALEELTEVSLGEIVLANLHDGVAVLMDYILPEGILAAEEQTQAEVTATFDGLEILELPVTKILPENLAEGMTAKNMTSSLAVTLRGPSEDLEAFDESALVAVADLSEYSQSGSFTVPVRIETGSETIGAVGEYTVTVEMNAVETRQ